MGNLCSSAPSSRLNTKNGQVQKLGTKPHLLHLTFKIYDVITSKSDPEIALFRMDSVTG